jgi:hypothetical protein
MEAGPPDDFLNELILICFLYDARVLLVAGGQWIVNEFKMYSIWYNAW